MRYIIPILLILTACSPQKRLQRLLDKHPELSRIDTIRDTISVPVPPDTLWRSFLLRDTVTIENERQVVRVVRVPTGSPCDTVPVDLDVQAVIKPDTIHHYIEIPVDRMVPCPPGQRVAAWWRTAALVLALVLVVFAYVTRSR